MLEIYGPKEAFIKKPGVITVVIGEPISDLNLSTSEITEKIRDWTLEQEKTFE